LRTKRKKSITTKWTWLICTSSERSLNKKTLMKSRRKRIPKERHGATTILHPKRKLNLSPKKTREEKLYSLRVNRPLGKRIKILLPNLTKA